MFKPRFGIEFTFVGKTDKLDNPYAAADKLRRRKGLGRAHYDGGALEIPTPILGSVEEASSFYHNMLPQVRALGFVARRVDKLKDGSLLYHGTGGGHIHVELPKKIAERELIMVNLLRFVVDRPWLSWVFNEWMDDENSQAQVSNRSARQLLTGRYRIHAPEWAMGSTHSFFLALRQAGGKGHSLRFAQPSSTSRTAEFRFFDAPRSWTQTKQHIHFALAAYTHAQQADLYQTPTCVKKSDIGKFKAREAVYSAFKNTVEMIGLKWADYEHYMQNFDDRALYGKLN